MTTPDAIDATDITIAVTGTHGRGTVASMIAWILEADGREPGFRFSTQAINFDEQTRPGKGRWFVVELEDPSKPKQPHRFDYVVCNYLDLVASEGDSQADVVGRMRRFLESNRALKESFVNLDCKGTRQLVEQAALRPTGYALQHRAEFRAGVIEGDNADDIIELRAAHRDDPLGSFELSIPGSYNAINALGAVAVASRLGVAPEVIADALRDYRGLQNRYAVSSGGGVTIIKDFVQNPAALRRVVRSTASGTEQNVIAVWAGDDTGVEAAVDDYADAFRDCHQVFVLGRDDMFPADALVGAIRERGVDADVVAEQSVVDRVVEHAGAGDRIAFLGDDAFLKQADHVQAEFVARAGQAPPEQQQQRFDSPLNEGDD